MAVRGHPFGAAGSSESPRCPPGGMEGGTSEMTYMPGKTELDEGRMQDLEETMKGGFILGREENPRRQR